MWLEFIRSPSLSISIFFLGTFDMIDGEDEEIVDHHMENGGRPSSRWLTALIGWLSDLYMEIEAPATVHDVNDVDGMFIGSEYDIEGPVDERQILWEYSVVNEMITRISNGSDGYDSKCAKL